MRERGYDSKWKVISKRYLIAYPLCFECMKTLARDRGYNFKWRRRSKLFLKAHPLCAECLKQNNLTPSIVVDHIIPHRGEPVLMWNETNNWQALYERCHNKKTRRYDNIPEYKYEF